MKKNELRNKAVSGLMWRFMERCGAQGVNFVVQIVLARLLVPELYGIVALVTVFTAILQIFVDSGLGNALIQKKNADDTDFSSVFYFNMVMCTLLYVGMFFASPIIAGFYKDTSLTPVIRVASLTLIISGFKNVQQAYVSKHMLFKRFFFSTLIGTIVAAVVGIGMAYAGYGVWALVIQDLTNKTIDTIVLWFTVKWRPKLLFSYERLKGLVSYGWKLLASGVIDSVYNNVRQLIIGRMYSPGELGLYNRGKQLPYTIINNINTSIDSVLFPAMSSVQDNKEHIKQLTRRSIKISSYVMWPSMLGIAFVAEPLICLLMTEKWLGCVPFLRIFCVTCAFYPIHTANLNAIKALGRSDLFLKLEIIKKAIGIIVLVSTMWFGVMVMAYSLLFTNVLSQMINAWPNKKLLNYSYRSQIRDIIPAILISILMGIFISPISMLGFSNLITLMIQIPLGMMVYIGCSKIFRLDSYVYILDIMKSFIKSRRS